MMLQCNPWSPNPGSFGFCFCLFGFIFCRLVSCGPSNLLRRPPTLLLWPPPICGALLVVYMLVALRAGASFNLTLLALFP